MIFTETEIKDVWQFAIEPQIDERGFFTRLFFGTELAEHGLPCVVEQSSLSRSRRAGILRGLHYQTDPHAEAKFVRCVRGAVFDVAVDLRHGSPTRGRWVGETLSADNGLAPYVGPGIAHGFQTLCDETDVLYNITPAYRAGFGTGVRWDDPSFRIAWPLPNSFMSERDAHYENWVP